MWLHRWRVPGQDATGCEFQVPSTQQPAKEQKSLEEVSMFIQSLLLPLRGRLGRAPLESLWCVPVNAHLQTMYTIPWNAAPKESATKC